MKSRFLLLTALLGTFHAASGQVAGMPDIAQVYRRFYADHEAKPAEPDGPVGFEIQKRADGWYAAPIVREGYDQVIAAAQRRALWTADSRTMKKIAAWEKTGAAEETDPASFAPLTSTDWLMYRRSPVYGYAGWEEDAIRILQPKVAALNDTLLYVLGRAYSGQAMMACGHFQGTRTSPPPAGPTDAAGRKAAFERAQRAAIHTFRMLADRNPAYPAAAGSIRTKWANETVSGWLLARLYFSDTVLARSFLVKECYSALSTALYSRILTACSKGAMLFAEGDFDTYILHYLQETEGLRRDVRVVNTSLLGIEGAYPAFLAAPLYGEDALKQTLPPAFFRGKPWYILRTETTAPMPVADLLSQLIRQGPEETSFAGGIYLERGGIRFSLRDQSYLTSAALRMMDLMNSAQGRDICLAGPAAEFGVPFYEDFIAEGFGARLKRDVVGEEAWKMSKALVDASGSFPDPQATEEDRSLVRLVRYVMARTPEADLNAELLKGLVRKYYSNSYFNNAAMEELALLLHLKKDGLDKEAALVDAGMTAYSRQCLAGPCFDPVTVEDPAESFRTQKESLKKIVSMQERIMAGKDLAEH